MSIVSFGGVVLPLVTAVQAALPGRIGAAATPGRSGGYVSRRYNDARTVTVSGVLNGAPGQSYDDIFAAWSALSTNLANACKSAEGLLYIRPGYSLSAYLETISDTGHNAFYINYEATFKASDPYYYSDTANTITVALSGTTTLTNGDLAVALPAFTVTTTGAGSATLSNTATGEAFTLVVSDAGGGTYTVDARTETVTVFTGADKMAGFSGRFVTLAPGANVITVTTTGAVSGIAATFRGRQL